MVLKNPYSGIPDEVGISADTTPIGRRTWSAKWLMQTVDRDERVAGVASGHVPSSEEIK